MRNNIFKIVMENKKELSYPCNSKSQKEDGAPGKVPVLPKGFESFIESDFCLDFACSIQDYCKCLTELETKKEKLEADAKSRKIPAPKILKYEVDQLETKAKRMSGNYARLVYKFRTTGGPGDNELAHCHSSL